MNPIRAGTNSVLAVAISPKEFSTEMVLKNKIIHAGKADFIQYRYDRYRDYFDRILQWGREIGFNTAWASET